MNNKEKQIEEMAYIIENAFKVYFGANDLVEPEDFPYQAKDLAKELLEHYQPKLPEDSVVQPTVQSYSTHDNDLVVLSREEYDNLRLQIQEAHNKGVRAGFDMTKFKENSIRKQERKETAKKIINQVREMLNSCQTVYEDDKYLITPNVGYLMKDVDDGLDKIEKQLGVEIKE